MINRTRAILLVVGLAFLAGCGGGDRKPERKMPDSTAVAGTRQEVGSGYAVIDIPNPGRITGMVKMKGKPSGLTDFEIPPDAAACATASKNNRLQSGAGGGIGSAVIYLDHVQRGKAFSSAEIAVDQRGCQYTPHVVAVPIGGTVVFTNSDDVMHNVRVENSSNDSVLLNRSQQIRGKRDSLKVMVPGPLPVGCDYHPWMNAYVFGVDNPYYAVTASDGSFSIEGIPPGTYTIRLWLNGTRIIPRKDNQGRIVRYGYSDPYTREKQIEVKAGAATGVEFEIAPQ
ncbi:MAG: hypothetical protein ABIR47_04205 [Candidatus Kapaibacterium sp.]